MNLVGIGLKVLTGLLSLVVTLRAAEVAWAIDLRANPVVTWLYCLFPGLAFFVFLLVRPLRMKAAALWLLAIGYLVTASMLNWRTCAEHGYCSTVASKVIETLMTKPVLASFAVAVLSLVSVLFFGAQRETEATRRRESAVK